MLPRRIPLLLLVLGSFSSAAKVDDSVHYLITFERADSGLEGGQLLEDNEKALKDDNSLRISTQNNENYICKMPEAPKTRAEDISTYKGPTPVEFYAMDDTSFNTMRRKTSEVLDGLLSIIWGIFMLIIPQW
ncbi:hypothetical protein Y032_0035g3002 [Ancylostoma ceylanicum]|uniref:Uncharacterized protein n=1 Tax=Ancylostoma ceylanicum TaxID=53326 RepID=A0A016UKE1_9BILA|nr:hypothetical protein Y032_0035g3002 [Ancylostoma ceylanicum]